MSLLGRLALLFVVVPILELVLLIQMGRLVGLVPTLALVVLTGVSGAWLARLEGTRTLWTFQAELARGRLPGNAIWDGVFILLGGALLLTPGILTDILGFSLLIPGTRRFLQRRVRARLERQIRDGSLRVTTWSGPSAMMFGGWGPRPTSPSTAPRSGEIEVPAPAEETDRTPGGQ